MVCQARVARPLAVVIPVNCGGCDGGGGAEKFEAAALGRVGAAAKELDQQRTRAVGLLLDVAREGAELRGSRVAI